jgi:hypothetical protein
MWPRFLRTFDLILAHFADTQAVIPRDARAFMRRYWQREPLLLRGAFPAFAIRSRRAKCSRSPLP